MRVTEYIEQILAKGQCTFSLDNAQQVLGKIGKSRAAITLSIEHLKQQKKIVSPAKGFYVIIPPEFRIYDCLPAEYFLPYLMEYWQEPYYVCLITAASYHGAAHQQPQTFQVMVKKYKPPIICGKVKIDFIANKHLELLPIQSFITPRSKMILSTPETTAMDLVNYIKQCGGLNRVVTVLDELQEAMKPSELLNLLKVAPHRYWKQRLGYILEKLGAEKLARTIFRYLQKLQRVDFIPLDTSLATKGLTNFSRNTKWKIIENSDFESDL